MTTFQMEKNEFLGSASNNTEDLFDYGCIKQVFLT